MKSTGCIHIGLLIKKRSAALIVAFLFFNTCSAQFKFRNYGAESGFPYTNVAAIVQDKQGFIWLGSSEGLTKWDGIRYQVFMHTDTDSASLADNNINCLFLDRDGKLWIGTRGGLSIYNPVENNFLNFHHHAINKNSLSSNDIWSIGQDSLGHMWVGTIDAGLNKLVLTTKGSYSFEHFLQDSSDTDSEIDQSVWSLYFDDKGYGWVGTSTGLKIFKPDKKEKIQFLHYKHVSGQASSLADNFIWRIYEDGSKNVWLTSINRMLDVIPFAADRTQLYFLHATPTIEKQLGLSISSVDDFVIDANGNSWISINGNGIWYGKLFIKDGKFFAEKGFHIMNDPRNSSSLADDMVWRIYCDSNGAIWCGTKKGVSVYDTYKEQFDAWGINRSKIFEEPISVTHIQTDQYNNTYIVSDNNLIVISPNGTYRQIDFGEPLVASCITKYGSLFTASFNRLFYSPPAIFSSLLSNNSDSLKAVYKEILLPSFQRINFLKLFNEELVVGGSGRLAIIDTKTLVIDSCAWLYDLLVATTQRIFRDVWLMNNLIWLGTDNGLYVFDRDKKKLIQVLNITSVPSISSNRINYLFSSEGNKMYIGTPNGLNVYDLTQQHLKVVSKQSGLSDNQVVNIAADKTGTIWLATRNGLSAYNPETNEVKNFTTENGLLINQLNTIAAGNNYVFIGSDRGLNVLNTSTSFKPPPPPIIAFTDFLIHGKSILQTNQQLAKSFHAQEKMKLNYLQNYFTISFASLDFSNPHANTYAYKLEDFDTGWIYSNNLNTATYTNLKAGTYTFRVKAANSYAVWNNKGIKLTITITPPWWQTNVFYVFSFLITIAIVYGIYRIRLNRILADQRTRNKIASDLHDDIGSSLSGISIYSELAKTKSKENQPELYRMLNAISQNTKITQQNMQDIVWSINPYNDTFDKIITRMKMFAAEVLEPKGIAIEFYAADSLDTLKLSPDKRKNLFLIYKEAINNCAKYSEARKVIVKIEKLKNKIHLFIKDDGKGFDKETVKRGNGLSTMKTRAAVLKGTQKITAIPGKGTCLEMVFPIT